MELLRITASKPALSSIVQQTETIDLANESTPKTEFKSNANWASEKMVVFNSYSLLMNSNVVEVIKKRPQKELRRCHQILQYIK